MARIISTARAVPPYNVKQALAAEYAHNRFGPQYPDIDRLVGIFESSRVENRQFCVSPEWFFSPKSFQEKNDTYIEWACRLGEEASRRCLEQVGLEPRDIDLIIFVSTTGLATPSVDARLYNLMGFRPDIKRLPIWGLGCVGGASGIALAHDYIKSYPGSHVLLVVVELCGLTFQYNDLGKSNLIALALFGDGAAAVLLGNEGHGPEIIATQTNTWPGSLDVMGWNLLNEGFQVVLMKAVPAIVNKHARENIGGFIGEHGLSFEDVDYYLFHPGGARVIEAYKKALCLDNGAFEFSEKVLRDHGNMSAATLPYILDDFMRTASPKEGSFGIMSALGPGFTAQNILFRT